METLIQKVESTISSITIEEQIPALVNFILLVEKQLPKDFSHDRFLGIVEANCRFNKNIDGFYQKILNHIAVKGHSYE
jgi:hypothetical protein